MTAFAKHAMRRAFHRACRGLGFEVRLVRTLERNREREALDRWCNLWNPLIRAYGIRTLLDIGSHVGQFATMIRRNNPDVRLVCFEPLPDSFEQLKKVCDRIGNAECHPVALGSENREMAMNVSDFRPSSSLLGMHDLHKREWPASVGQTQQTVRVCRLDDVPGILDLETPLAVKIDVQGFEAQVIAGGPSVLSRAELVVIETVFSPLYVGQPVFSAIYEKMGSLGFVYQGALETARSKTSGKVLFEDSIFARARPADVLLAHPPS